MIGNDTTMYKRALENEKTFPKGTYTLSRMYEIFKTDVGIPPEHLRNRPDKNYPIWKNNIHSVRNRVSRIEYVGNEMYIFN